MKINVGKEIVKTIKLIGAIDKSIQEKYEKVNKYHADALDALADLEMLAEARDLAEESLGKLFEIQKRNSLGKITRVKAE